MLGAGVLLGELEDLNYQLSSRADGVRKRPYCPYKRPGKPLALFRRVQGGGLVWYLALICRG